MKKEVMVEMTALALAQQELALRSEQYRQAQANFKKAEQRLEETKQDYLDSRASYKRASDDFNSKSVVQDLDTL